MTWTPLVLTTYTCPTCRTTWAPSPGACSPGVCVRFPPGLPATCWPASTTPEAAR